MAGLCEHPGALQAQSYIAYFSGVVGSGVFPFKKHIGANKIERPVTLKKLDCDSKAIALNFIHGYSVKHYDLKIQSFRNTKNQYLSKKTDAIRHRFFFVFLQKSNYRSEPCRRNKTGLSILPFQASFFPGYYIFWRAGRTTKHRSRCSQ